MTTVVLKAPLNINQPTVVYSIIFVTGVVGNVCTAVVICRNRYMHTATNYYLCNLVLSDLLVLALGLPVETYSFWSAYPTAKLTGLQSDERFEETENRHQMEKFSPRCNNVEG